MSEKSFMELFDDLGARVAYHEFLSDPRTPLLDFEQFLAMRELQRIPAHGQYRAGPAHYRRPVR